MSDYVDLSLAFKTVKYFFVYAIGVWRRTWLQVMRDVTGMYLIWHTGSALVKAGAVFLYQTLILRQQNHALNCRITWRQNTDVLQVTFKLYCEQILSDLNLGQA